MVSFVRVSRASRWETPPSCSLKVSNKQLNDSHSIKLLNLCLQHSLFRDNRYGGDDWYRHHVLQFRGCFQGGRYREVGLRISRISWDGNKAYQRNLPIHFLCIFKSQWSDMCLLSGLKQYSNSWTLMGMGALTKKSSASKVIPFFLKFFSKS